MLRILPYIMIWMGFWLLYFPAVDLNPVTNAAKMETSLPTPLEVGHAPLSVIGSFLPTENAYPFFTGPTAVFGLIKWKPWFWGSGASMLMLALLLLYWDKKSRLGSEQRTLQKIRELEQAALRSQMNPHFIFNALNSIQSFIVDGDKKSSALYLAKFSKLVRSTIHFSNAKKISLEQELDMLHHYLELEKLRFKGSFDYEINVHPALDTFHVGLPPMMVQPFIENAIIHGIGPMERKGEITVDFKPQNGALVVTILDNGIGICVSKKLKEKSRPQHKSMGMNITKKRLQLLSPERNYQKMAIRELVDVEGEVVGTEVELKIMNCLK